jgi:hypothetical protein
MLKKHPRDRAQLLKELDWWAAATGAVKPKPAKLKSMGDNEIQSLLIEIREAIPLSLPIIEEDQ